MVPVQVNSSQKQQLDRLKDVVAAHRKIESELLQNISTQILKKVGSKETDVQFAALWDYVYHHNEKCIHHTDQEC